MKTIDPLNDSPVSFQKILEVIIKDYFLAILSFNLIFKKSENIEGPNNSYN